MQALKIWGFVKQLASDVETAGSDLGKVTSLLSSFNADVQSVLGHLPGAASTAAASPTPAPAAPPASAPASNG